MRNVAYGLGDAASWESAWQQHKFVLELAGKHSARDSASRGVALSRLKDLCAAEGYPPIDSAKAHNVVNCMVAAGLLGKREAYVKDGRDRGASTSVVFLARFAPAADPEELNKSVQLLIATFSHCNRHGHEILVDTTKARVCRHRASASWSSLTRPSAPVAGVGTHRSGRVRPNTS